MANTFKVKTKASLTTGLAAIYTVPGSTTAVVLGLTLANKTGSAITTDVLLVSDTSQTETNANVYLLKGTTIPANTTLEVFGGQKLVLQATDVIQGLASTGSALDVALSIMEIT